MDTVRVEGFSSTLRGNKIWVVGDEKLVPNRLHVVEQELLGRGRKVLITTEIRKHLPKWAQGHDWDATFRIHDANDLRLALTYVANATRPIRVVWLGEEPSPQVLERLTQKDVTFIGYGSVHPRDGWDAIFFPSSMDPSRIEETLISRMGSAKLSHFNLRSVLPELKAVKAGLVWSNLGESEKAGSLYWYDIAEGEAPQPNFDWTEAVTFLRDLSDRIASAK